MILITLLASLAFAADDWFPVAAANSTPRVDGGSAAADKMRAFPALALGGDACGRTIDEVGVAVRTSTLNEEVRIALYLDNGDNYPGELLVDFGAMPVDTVGDELLSASYLVDCTSGPIWAAIWQSSGGKLAGMAPGGFGPSLGSLSSFDNAPVVGWESTQTYTVGASVFPATFPSGASKLTHSSGGVPTFFVHFE